MGCGASADSAKTQSKSINEPSVNETYNNVSALAKPSEPIEESALGSSSRRKTLIQFEQVTAPSPGEGCRRGIAGNTTVDAGEDQAHGKDATMQPSVAPLKEREKSKPTRSENRRVTLPGDHLSATNQSSDHTSSQSRRSYDRSASGQADTDHEQLWPIGDVVLAPQLPRRDDSAASPSSRRVTRGPSMLLVDPIDPHDAAQAARESRLSSIGRPATSVAGEDLSGSRDSGDHTVTGAGEGPQSFLYQASEGAPLRTESGAAFAFGSFEGIGSTPGSIFYIPQNFQRHLLSPQQANLKRASESSSTTTTTTTTSGTVTSLGSAQYRPLLGSGSAFVSQQNLPQFSPHQTQSLHNRSSQSGATGQSLSAAIAVPANTPQPQRNPPQTTSHFAVLPLPPAGESTSQRLFEAVDPLAGTIGSLGAPRDPSTGSSMSAFFQPRESTPQGMPSMLVADSSQGDGREYSEYTLRSNVEGNQLGSQSYFASNSMFPTLAIAGGRDPSEKFALAQFGAQKM